MAPIIQEATAAALSYAVHALTLSCAVTNNKCLSVIIYLSGDIYREPMPIL